MESVYLEFREGTSDKFYRIVAVEVSGQWMTSVWWGRRGSTGQTQLKYIGQSEAQAKACLSDLYHQKRAKGYQDALDPLRPAAGSAPAPVPTITPASTVGVPRFPAMKARERDIDWDDLEDYVMEEKFDGHRAGLTFNPDGTIVVRNVYGDDKGRIENMPHIKDHLRELESITKSVLADGTLIDGELVGLTLQETTHLLGAGGRNDPRLRFVAFDLPFVAGEDLRGGASWRRRRGLLEDLFENLSPGPVSLAQIHAPDAVTVQEIWDRGGEGAILKPIRSKYVPGGRYDWLKVKEHHTADAVITGWVPGNGKYTNQLGAVVLSQFKGNAFVEVTKVSGMTDAVRLDMSTNWSQWQGRVIEFEYQSKTPNSYRHPRFVRPRDDKSPIDCTWETSP